jgi:hypothetical protein
LLSVLGMETVHHLQANWQYVIWSRCGRPKEAKMAFRFDRNQAQKPLKVGWRLNPSTVARLDEIAGREGVRTEQVAQQMLDHVLRSQARGLEVRPGEAVAQE